MPRQFIRFSIDIDYERYLSVYQGFTQSITVVAEDGRSLNFPAGNIRRFLTRSGIQGRFEMELTDRNKFIALRKLA
ncbi:MULTISPECIES: DUF2835 domain-containing protein [Methylomonas]|uniref:DUF2835 domain-containing protein n=1 Tax=Methylomonas TaxID=416 RepID=UPI0012328244|nr:DUF2835 domain-containing protein [Methylomonas rhizoryzae]